MLTVRDFCMRKTKVGELVVIRDKGYIVACAWIDNEDLFAIHSEVNGAIVKSDEWGTIKIVDNRDYHYLAPCHYVDI